MFYTCGESEHDLNLKPSSDLFFLYFLKIRHSKEKTQTCQLAHRHASVRLARRNPRRYRGGAVVAASGAAGAAARCPSSVGACRSRRRGGCSITRGETTSRTAPHDVCERQVLSLFARCAGEGGVASAHAPLARWRSRRSSAPAPPHGPLHRLPPPLPRTNTPHTQLHISPCSPLHTGNRSGSHCSNSNCTTLAGGKKKLIVSFPARRRGLQFSSHQVDIWRDRMPMFLSPPRWIHMAIPLGHLRTATTYHPSRGQGREAVT